MQPIIRDYQSGDEQAAYYVCLKTGDSGKDGEPLYADDPDALGRIYVGPYLKFEPGLSLMLQDGEGVAGYALAALDSRNFYDRYDREWRPQLCEQFADPSGNPSDWSPVERAYHDYHHPDYHCPASYDDYPSHLHIDLLARTRGRGFGRKMIAELLERLMRKGSPGVHLGLGETNDAAYGFYLALGFEELERHDGAIYMGRRLA